jgi:hypothetical protein
MLAPLDYDRYRVLDEVVRLPTLRIVWAEVDGRRVQLVTAPPVPQTGRLTVLRRLAERESIGVDGVCPYLASGVDDLRTWVAFAAPDAPTLTELAEAVQLMPSLANPVVTARIVADAAIALRDVGRLAPSLPSGGLDDLRVGPDGKVVIGFLGEVLVEPRLDELQVVAELGRWLERLGGRNSPLHALAAGITAGSIRRLPSLIDELERLVEAQGGVTRTAVGAWVRRHGESRPSIAPPLLIDDPLDPEPSWARASWSSSPPRDPGATPVPTGPRRAGGDVGHAPPAASPIGAVIGGYRLVKRVGNGMMGRVYDAVRTSDNRRVALKLMLPADDDPEMVAEYRSRFHREVEALARLSHTNIVRILEFGYDEEGWLSMEYVDGSTLSKILRIRGHLPPLDVVTIARQLCSALGHAHTHGVIHRDLKPGNVILEGDDPARVRLVDFGLAKEWDGTAEATNDGTLLGTPHYMSPEQCRGEAARVESDIYALGMMMYRLLTGRMPFENERGAAIFIAHLKSPVPTFGSLGLPFEIPPGIEAVVRKCLEKRPENRFRSALALDFALRGCLEASAQGGLAQRPAPDLRKVLGTARESLEEALAAGRRAGPGGLAAMAASILLVGFVVVGGATSATVAWVVSSITGGGGDASDHPEATVPSRTSLRSVGVPPIPAVDHPPAVEIPEGDEEASSAFEPSRGARDPSTIAASGPGGGAGSSGSEGADGATDDLAVEAPAPPFVGTSWGARAPTGLTSGSEAALSEGEGAAAAPEDEGTAPPVSMPPPAIDAPTPLDLRQRRNKGFGG